MKHNKDELKRKLEEWGFKEAGVSLNKQEKAKELYDYI